MFDFVNASCLEIFHLLEIKTKLLKKHPKLWQEDPNFNHGLETVSSLKVVNDSAERGVALIKAFNDSISSNEEQKKFLLQVVQKHHSDFFNAKCSVSR